MRDEDHAFCNPFINADFHLYLSSVGFDYDLISGFYVVVFCRFRANFSLGFGGTVFKRLDISLLTMAIVVVSMTGVEYQRIFV